MGWIERVIISATKKKLNKALNLSQVSEIASEGLREYRDISYNNRSGKELMMDIFEPIVLERTELPVGKDQKNPAKIVCVRNKKNKKDWIAFICTNPILSEEEIIRIYGKRWQIEVFFKTCKSYLQLVSECHSLSYDALTAHVAIVFVRYMMIALEQRKDEDFRSLGEIFFYFTDELADITFAESLQILLKAMFECIYAIFQVTDEQMDTFIEMFINRLPEYMQRALTRVPIAA